jgi:hypothetical protein
MTIKQFRDALVARGEERYLRMALARYGGRIDQTARSVGIGTRALYDAMQRYGLRKEDFRHGGDSIDAQPDSIPPESVQPEPTEQELG